MCSTSICSSRHVSGEWPPSFDPPRRAAKQRGLYARADKRAAPIKFLYVTDGFSGNKVRPECAVCARSQGVSPRVYRASAVRYRAESQVWAVPSRARFMSDVACKITPDNDVIRPARSCVCNRHPATVAYAKIPPGIHAETNNEPHASLAASRRVIRTTWLIVGYISQYITVSGRERGAFGNVLNVSTTDCAANYVSMTVALIVYRTRERERRKE